MIFNIQKTLKNSLFYKKAFLDLAKNGAISLFKTGDAISYG
ncbi:hypothetical protein [Chryseobacterium jejuense]|uniref:Uncharacterized protein n=1 Tax=Chryseobacterium jejuense TaxID=445960 RepID=A0A2X2VQL1_CHRJE|nr:hypothetical protein [Chryseobacterium jejuense]SDJ11829.1 hypothetical protein SAMN05421542_2706 [Chryseobacterium jejuense]SQB27941.1 Uncharacterised protein [Chryseobacterium jejuense]